MIQDIIEITVLEPSEGKVLTNGETYSRKVYLGINDSPANWTEIDESEIPEEQQQEEDPIRAFNILLGNE